MPRQQLTPKQSDSIMRRIESPFEREVANEKDRYLNETIRTFPTTGRLSEELFQEHRRMMTLIEAKYTRRAVHAFGLRVKNDVISSAKNNKQLFSTDFEQVLESETFFDRLSALWMALHGAEQANLASETTRNDIRRAIVDVQGEEGPSTQKIVERLALLKEINKSRAKVIARTEIHNSATFASEETAKSISRDVDEPLLKRWIPAEDERTRQSHAVMINHPAIPLDQSFTVGGQKMSRPGDPNGSAANVINCRCVLVYEFAE
jgi:uncharacterized protein with gpF-like domain